MTKKSYIIDVTKTVFPFGQEYWPNKAEPVSQGSAGLTDDIAAVDMKNVLPTPFGHTSFFGTTPLGGLKLPPMTERVFTYKDSLNNNTLIALGGYGAMFTNDGITWTSTEIDNWVAQAATNLKYEYIVDMSKQYIGFLDAMATVTVPGSIAGALVSNDPSSLTDKQDLILLPTTVTTHHKAAAITVAYDEAEAYDMRTRFINPNIASVVVGRTYVMVAEKLWVTYTASAGDTVATVLQALVLLYLIDSGNNTRGLFAEYISDTRVKLWADSNYSSVYLPQVYIYEVPVANQDVGVVATLANDEVPVSITPSAQGNLGFVVFTNANALTSGDFNIRRMGKYQTGGTFTGIAGVTPTNSGDLNYTDINLLLGQRWYMPLTDEFYALRQFSGANQAGLTAVIHDTGIPISNVELGATGANAKQRISCRLQTTDVVVGRTYILQSKGQLGSYIAVLNDTITTVVAGCVSAYNLAGVAVATQTGDQIISSSSFEELHFQPSPSAVMTHAANSTVIYHVKNFVLGRSFVSAADQNQLYSILLVVATLSTNIKYTIYCDDRPVPVTSSLGAWTDANYEFTSAQVGAANTAGTKLFVRITGKNVSIVPRDAGGGIIGHVDFKLRKVLSGITPLNSHIGPLAELCSTSVPATTALYNIYTMRPNGILHRLLTVPSDPAVQQFISAYDSIDHAIVTGLTITGLTPDTPTVETFQFNAAVDENSDVLGDFRSIGLISDKYTPISIALSYKQFRTLATINVVTYNITLGIQAIAFTAYFALPTDLALFRIQNPWTIAIIKNRLYCYRNGQGAGTYILRLLADGTAWEQLTPTFANMAQIDGITSARGRMVMWDTTGSVYTSSVTDPVDFTPSLKTRANVAKIDAVKGNIVLCLAFKEGYIIYTTANIVLATFVGDTTTFKYSVLSNEQGILNTKAVVIVDDTLQFAYTQAGLYAVSAQGIQDVSPEASAYFKSSALSPRLDYLENRYLSIAFSPETPSWTVSKEEQFAGVLIGTVQPPAHWLSPPKGYNLDGSNIIDLQVTIFAPFYTQGVSVNVELFKDTTNISLGESYRGHDIPQTLIRTYEDALNFMQTLRVPQPLERGKVVANPADPANPFSGVWRNTYTPLGNDAFPGVPPASLFIGAASSAPTTTVRLYVPSTELLALSAWILREKSQLALISGYTIGAFYQYDANNEVIIPTQRSYVDLSSSSLTLYNDVLYSWGYIFSLGLDIGVSFSSFPAPIGQSVIPGSLLKAAQALINGTIATTLPISPQVSVPPSGQLILPGGSFITTQGTAEPTDPIYSRALILDTQLKNWGSCDVPFRTMIDFIPVNERSLNPITQGAITTKFTYQNLAKAFAIMKQDGTLNLCTQDTTDSVLEFGDIGFTNTGVTRFLGALASFATETGTVLEVLGSRDGERLHPLFTASSTSTNGTARLYTVLTGKWFRLRITGRFDLKQLTFDGELGGTR